MRSGVVGAGLLLWVAAVSVGCDSDEPLELEERNTDLLFQGSGAVVPVFEVYNLYLDSEDPGGDGIPDGDGNPDDIDGDGEPDVSFYCVEQAMPTVTPDSVPWPFAVQIRVLKQGESFPRVIVQSITSPPDFGDPTLRNLTSYDEKETTSSLNALAAIPVVRPDGSCRSNPAVSCNPDIPGSCESDVCVPEGTCDDNPSIECSVSSSNPFECQGTACDCALAGLGFCCTAERENESLSDACNPATHGKCSADEAFPCRPGCSEMGSPPGTLCNPANLGIQFRFDSNPRILTAAHRDVVRATSNFINDFDPALAPTSTPTGGVCSGGDLGPVGIQGGGEPFSVQLDKGDTLLVEARRFSLPPPGMTFTTEPGITAILFVDGKRFVPTGSVTTGTTEAGAIDFTFTAR